MAMRAHIVRKIELDFKNNSFQKMIEEKNKKTLLSNWKNATHADEWIYSQVIGSMLKFQEQLGGSSDERSMQDYIHEIEGTALRLLSDSNISSKYHSSLTEDMDKKYSLENDSIYAVTMPFKYSIALSYRESLLHMPQKNKDEMLCQGIRFDTEIYEKKLFYFVGEQEQSMLIVIPIIQNALKYCKRNNCVTIYCEPKAETV